MGGNAVKTIVFLMVLIVLSLCIGAQVSENIQNSIGAFGIIGAVVGAFVMLLQGKSAWKMLYFLPMAAMGIPRGNILTGEHNLLPLGYALSAAAFIYCLLMWGMGYIRVRWRSVVLLDVLVALVVCLMAASFVRYPVGGMGGFNPFDAEYVGGREYVWCIAALLYYVAISCMSGSAEEMNDTIKKTLYVLLFFQLLYVCYALSRLGGRAALVEERGESAVRNGFLSLPGTLLVYYVYTKGSLLSILSSVKRMLIGLLGMVLVVFSGSREPLVALGEVVIFVSFLKREFSVFLFLGLALYGGLFFAGSQKLLHEAPYTVQRVLSIIPGVPVRWDIRHEAEGSSETRRLMWVTFFDPHYGFIKDYVWGDGYQTSVRAIERSHVAFMRDSKNEAGKTPLDFAYGLAKAGSWHNGWMTTVHRIGFVGLVLLNMVFICGLVMLTQVWRAYEHHPLRPYIMTVCLPFVYWALSYPWGTQIVVHFFYAWQYLAIIKILYCAAREQGRLQPLFRREEYVPLVVREIESGRL